jgi:subtilase family protein
MLTRPALTRPARWLAALVAAPLVATLAPGLTPAAHADSTAWAKRLGRDFIAAQQITKGKGVKVAILSSGVDGRVATLRGAVLRGRDFVRTPGPKLVTGTLLASLIAGSGPSHDSPFGMRGLAPGVKILPVRVYPDLDDEPRAKGWFDRNDPAEVLAQGIRYAADQGAGVIMAPSYGSDGNGISAAVAYAQSKNAVVVSSNAQTSRTLPAANAGTIGVAAVTEKGARYGQFSGKNSSALVAAPGFKLPSVGPRNSLYEFWGAAPATAWVAAAAALVRSEYPKLTPAQVTQVITQSAHHPKGGYNTDIGFGIINPIGALRQARAVTKQPPAAVATQRVVSDTAHFGGAAPEPIGAVRHDVRLLAGFSGLAGGGLLILLLVLVLALRGRRRTVMSSGTAAPAGLPQSASWHAAPGAMGSVPWSPAPGGAMAPPPAPGGHMGGPMSGPMAGPTGGPIGGPMGGPIGLPMGGSMGGPMGGPTDGPTGGAVAWMAESPPESGRAPGSVPGTPPGPPPEPG